MAITKRSIKGSPLTHTELDDNFQHLIDEQARTATTGSNTFTGNQIFSGSVVADIYGVTGSFTGSFTGDGTNLSGITAEWDGTHSGNATISQTLTVNHLSSSGDVVVNGNIKDSIDGTSYIDLSNGKLAFQSNGEMFSIKSGSTTTEGIVIGNQSGAMPIKIYGTQTDHTATSSIDIYGTVNMSGSDYRDGDLLGLNVTGDISASGDIVANGITGSELWVEQYIKHIGDTNTLVNFTDNRIRFQAGGIAMLGMHKDGDAPYPVTVNNGGNRVNFRAMDRNTELLLKTDSEAFNVGLYFAGNKKLETQTDGISVTGVVSASGDLKVDGSVVDFNNLPTTSGSVSSGQLYTMSGSEFGASAAMADRKFVMVKE